MTNVVDRFLKYVKYDTQSQEDVDNFPSTPKQLLLLKELASELIAIGLKDVTLDEYGYVFGTLPSNIESPTPTIGFIAHVDTSPAISGKNVNPKIVENYNGEDIILNKELNLILSPNEFPDLKDYKGQDIITTDGTTLLGADDKAGIVEILTAMEHLIVHPEIKHGTVRVGFTPDEEVGRGVDFFNVERFNADFAYTLDGGKLGELEYENFNAAKVLVTVKGKSAHTGSAKNILKNSIIIASEFLNMLPAEETPENTEGYEGFYHIDGFNGTVEQTKMKYILRDFDETGLITRKANIVRIAEALNKKYGEDTVMIDIKDQYFNMIEKIKEHIDIVETASKAMVECGIKPIINPIRGGTDGARLSFMGLPTPNLFTGGHNYHGRYEYIPIPSMDKAVNVILKIIEIYAGK